jgi:tellurite methyltransferase
MNETSKPESSPGPDPRSSSQREAGHPPTWRQYYEASAGGGPRETLLQAAEYLERSVHGTRPRLAVDLGCGTGRDTLELLARGWKVLAIDQSPDAVKELQARVPAELASRLDARCAGFTDVRWGPVDLVNASFALTFCRRERFAGLWSQIASSLPPGGVFAGQLFGDRDGWASIPERTHHRRDEAKALLAGFELVRFEEVEDDFDTALGTPKHWHFFHVVARKR